MSEVHVVRQGECLASIARRHGFASWRTLYEHPDNAEFRAIRPNPNLIFPGDEIVIPSPEPRVRQSCATGQVHQFTVYRASAKVRIVLQDAERRPLANAAYMLTVDGHDSEGVADGDGLIEQRIDLDAASGRLEVWPSGNREDPSLHWQVYFGHLDPIDELSGIQARLDHLGYAPGPIDGLMGPKTRAAVKDFQEAHGLDVDGIPGPKTRAKLESEHGC